MLLANQCADDHDCPRGVACDPAFKECRVPRPDLHA
jgi:hypothetical protein